MKQKVVYARFHTSVFIPGVGSLGDVLPPSNKLLKDLKMVYTDHGLEVTCIGKDGPVDLLIPTGNIAIAQYAPSGRTDKPLNQVQEPAEKK